MTELQPHEIIALHWICDCGGASENVEENAHHVISELARAGYRIISARRDDGLLA